MLVFSNNSLCEGVVDGKTQAFLLSHQHASCDWVLG